MREIIIKLFKSKEDFKEIAEVFGKIVENLNGKLMSAIREGEYENQIFQIGENKSDVEIIVRK